MLDNVDDARFLLDAQATRRDQGDDSKSAARPLRKYLPRCERGSALVTTRSKEAALKLVEQRNIIIVEPMDKAEGLALFEKKLGQRGLDSDIVELAAALEYMPLAIVQAAANISHRAPRCSGRQYLDEYKKSERQQTDLLNCDEGHPRRDWQSKNSIIITWQISFEYIEQTQPSAADLLSLMSFFDRQGIPEALLKPRNGRREIQKDARKREIADGIGDSDSEDTASLSSADNDEFENAIMVLRNFYFISTNHDWTTFEMHALVQLAMRKRLESNRKLEQWRQQFVGNLRAAFPTGEYENWATCQALFAHAKAAMGQRPKDELSIAEWATVLYRVAWFAERTGKIADAKMLAKKAMKARKEVLGQEHEDTLRSMAMVRAAYAFEGQSNDAEKLRIQVMKTSKTKLGADHSTTLSSMSDLALTYSEQGR